MRGFAREGRDSGDYSAESEVRKNRRERERESCLGWTEDLEYAWEEAEMHKYGGLFEKERKSEIAREIGEKMSSGRS